MPIDKRIYAEISAYGFCPVQSSWPPALLFFQQ